MGSNTSKQNSETPPVSILKKDLDVDANSDPRSPTPEIVRTPLQGKTGVKHNITKNADLRKTFENSNGEEKMIHNNPILSAVIKSHLLSYDPRSPSTDFERTPIIIAASKIEDFANERKLREQCADNCGSPCLKKDDSEENYDSCAEAQESPEIILPKNLCNGFLDLTLNDTLKDNEEPLGSSTASNDAIENNISKEVKATTLLETNFDYVETDKFEESTDVQSKVDLDNIPVFKILDKDPRSPTAGIERTPIVVAKSEENESVENVEEMSDESLIKVLQTANVGLRQSVRSCDDGVEGGLMIYEDESANLKDTPKKSKSEGITGDRTPLSCMKNKDTGHSRSKSANEKGVKALPYKTRKASHIPRLKSLSKPIKSTQNGSSISLKNTLGKSGLVVGDCENTPPHSHRDRWDKDNSIVL